MVMAFLVLPLLGFFSFEVGRANLCQQQLQNALDAASLACTASLAMNDDPSPQVAHDNAVAAALEIFRQNTILGMNLGGANTVEVGTTGTNPAPGQAHLFFQFRNPITNVVEPRTSATAQRVEVFAAVGSTPAFGKYVGINNFIVRTQSHGTTPDLDVVLCYDCSGSIDDQTPVTVVRRVWNNPLQTIDYLTPTGSGRPTSDTIYNIELPPATGTSLNATPPQRLDLCTAWNFNPILRGGFANTTEQSTISEAGRPPGNTVREPDGFLPVLPQPPAGFPRTGAGAANDFTDMVVNIDGRRVYGGTVINYMTQNYDFPNVASLVEAARGNLDTVADYNNSRANTSLPTITPKPGYQAAYLFAANRNAQPIQSARDASVLFAQILNNDAHAHFGFVAFTDFAAPTGGGLGYQITSNNLRNVATNYGTDNTAPLPLSPLDPGTTVAATRFTEINQSIVGGGPVSVPGPTATGATNIGDAINKAVTELVARRRPNAKRAIVLFTDGQPTAGGADPWAFARAAAVNARNQGIPVYTIGLAQIPAIVAGQNAILNDTNSNPSSGGIAAISGQGAIYNQVQNQAQLRLAFEKIARRLVQLVQIR